MGSHLRRDDHRVHPVWAGTARRLGLTAAIARVIAIVAQVRNARQWLWHSGPTAASGQVVLGLLAAVAIVGLLLAFHQVVRGAVAQGESRRHAVAVHADATWRCEALRGIGQSQACLAQLNVSSAGGTARPAIAAYASR